MLPLRPLLLACAASFSAAGLAVAQTPSPADPDEALVQALSDTKPFLRGEYKLVRAAFAAHFARKHADDLKAGFGDDHAALTAWLDANPDARDLLYTAVDPDADDARQVLAVFRDLWKADADRVKAFPNVAVAVAVTWDRPRAVYDYRGHQVRTKSTLPDGVMGVGPAANFDHLTKADGPVKAAAQYLPWEFLVHVVNHRTPADERAWVAKNYLRRRAGIGTSYKDVEYDTEMLRTQSQVCKLNGHPYTLPSILRHGGVCAMQADFAARVAKSLAVPAEYVRGESNSGGLHAWVMWVEVRSAQKDRIDFALLSEGRYLGDQYYVGTLTDPKTGREMTDRDMERRLTFVGQAPQNARQADLLMRAFPAVRDRKEMTTAQQTAYLQRVLDVFPSDERAWLALAELGEEKKLTGATASALMDKAATVFQNFPDFSWRLAGDLLTPVTDRVSRARKYELLVKRYETVGRPDLACEARLALVGYQAEAKDWQRAAVGLAQTIRKFPAEGRYVPKMMEKLQEVCKQYRGGTDLLAKFYLEILPQVPKTRGDEVSQYCVSMHEQAAAFFKANSKPREAALVDQQLAVLRGRR